MARHLFPASDDNRTVIVVADPGGDMVAAQADDLVEVAAIGSETPITSGLLHEDLTAITTDNPLLVDDQSRYPRFHGQDNDTKRYRVRVAGGPWTEVTADLQDQIDVGVPMSRQIIAGTGLTGGGDLTTDRTLAVTYGTTAGTAAQGNDSRMSDARTPTTHTSSHAAAGADPVTQPAILRRTADAYAATVTPDISTSDLLDVGTLTGNVTIANPTGSPVDGQVLRLRLAQDGTGGRTVTFGAAYVYGTDVTADLVPTDADARWVMMVMYHAGAAEWWIVSIVRGY